MKTLKTQERMMLNELLQSNTLVGVEAFVSPATKLGERISDLIQTPIFLKKVKALAQESGISLDEFSKFFKFTSADIAVLKTAVKAAFQLDVVNSYRNNLHSPEEDAPFISAFDNINLTNISKEPKVSELIKIQNLANTIVPASYRM